MDPTHKELVALKDYLKLKEKRLDDKLESVTAHIARLEEANDRVSEIQQQQCEKLKEIEERLNAVNERQKEFHSFHDNKMRELESKEEMLNKKHEALIELVNEKEREFKEVGNDFLVTVHPAMGVLEGKRIEIEGRIKEFQDWESVASESLSAKVKEAELIRESVEKRFKQLEIMEREFDSFEEEKKRELMVRERRLVSLEATVSAGFKEVEAQEKSLNDAHSTVAASAKEAELRKESRNRHS